MPERIHKIISSHGAASRREAERMILAGRVTVNGAFATIGQSAQYGIDLIEIDGVPLAAKASYLYIALNKPRGYVTTMHDERGRKTVVSLLDGVDSRVYPIGRLDINTSGLLLLTNDGEFANTIMHPSYEVTKTYEAHVNGDDIVEASELLRQPMEIDAHPVQALSVSIVTMAEGSGKLEIAIKEGRNRQIRKMCSIAGLEVSYLKRVSIGPVKLGSLRTGKWRQLTEEERLSLKKNSEACMM